MTLIKVRDTEMYVDYQMNKFGQIEVWDIEIGDVNVFELIRPSSLIHIIEDECLKDWKKYGNGEHS